MQDKEEMSLRRSWQSELKMSADIKVLNMHLKEIEVK